MKHALESLRLAAVFAACILVLWWAVASAVWPWRNPKANDTTTFTELPSVLMFRKLPEYQP